MAQPRRDPSRQAEAFEASFFPKVIDRIFKFAPPEALMVLRATCVAFRESADLHFVHHVVVHPYEDARNHSELRTTAPDGLIPRLNWYDCPKLVQGIRHLDMLTTEYPPWVEDIDHLDTLRYVPSRGGIHGSINFGITDHREDVTVCLGVQTVVIDEKWCPNPLPKSITFIFPTPPSAVTRDPPLLHEYTGRLLWDFASSVTERLRMAFELHLPLPINLVNCDSWFRPPPGVGDSASSQYEPPADFYPFYRSHDELKSSIRPLLLQNFSSDDTETLLNYISASTLDEYRARVGEERLRWETESVAEQQRRWEEQHAAERSATPSLKGASFNSATKAS